MCGFATLFEEESRAVRLAVTLLSSFLLCLFSVLLANCVLWAAPGYAGEMDWREDNRRVANGGAIVGAAATPVSRQWKIIGSAGCLRGVAFVELHDLWFGGTCAAILRRFKPLLHFGLIVPSPLNVLLECFLHDLGSGCAVISRAPIQQ